MLNRVYTPNYRVETYPAIGFIDKTYFKSLSDKNTTIEDIYNSTYNSYNNNKNISDLTKSYLNYVNKEIFRIVLNIFLNEGSDTKTQETEYVKSKFKAEVLEQECVLYPEDNLCYEIIPVNNDKFLIVISKGFINYVTSTKENYKEFLLSCLRAFDRFNCSTSVINKLYVNLLLNDKYLDLVKLRVE